MHFLFFLKKIENLIQNIGILINEINTLYTWKQFLKFLKFNVIFDFRKVLRKEKKNILSYLVSS